MAYALIPVLLANLAGFPMSGLDMGQLQQLNQELGRCAAALRPRRPSASARSTRDW